MRVRVKICCIAGPDEAQLAVDAGADAVGLVSAMPSPNGVIDEDTIARVARRVPPGVDSFLLTALTRAGDIADQHGRCGTVSIQLVDEVDPAELGRLRALLPGVRLVQVLHMTEATVMDRLPALADRVDALLLDSGTPGAERRELGGTGRVHDWSLSAELVRATRLPVWLAGGLDPDNVAAAIGQVRPFGVDVCSGLRPAGRLDPARLRAFIQAVSRR